MSVRPGGQKRPFCRCRGHRCQRGGAGPVLTPLNPADRDPEGALKFGSDPMKRPAQPEEIAAVVFRASPSCASYITGEILPIIGGYSGG